MRCRSACSRRPQAEGAKAVVISAAIEAEIATLAAEERDAFLADLGLHETGLNRMIRAGYELLGLITFFTAGPKEARAWTVHRGAKAPEAAGEIHTDFERGFIRAETIAYDDFVALRRRNGRQGRRQDALRRQGICRPGRRRPAVPLQRLTALPPRVGRQAAEADMLVEPAVERRHLLPERLQHAVEIGDRNHLLRRYA